MAKMEGNYRPLSALKCVSELPEPGLAINTEKRTFSFVMGTAESMAAWAA